MTNPVSRAKVFLNKFKQVHNKKFPYELPSASIETGESRAEDLIYYEIVKDDRDTFREFHNTVTKLIFRIPEFQCTLTNPASACLIFNEIPFNEVEIECECSEIAQLPASKNLHEKGIEEVDEHQSLMNGHLDYLFASELSMPLIDQLSCKGCVCTGMLKWENDERVLAKINNAYEAMGFERLHAMLDSHTRMFISLFSYNFAIGDICYESFN